VLYQSSLRELRVLLSDDLQRELDALVRPLQRQAIPTASELRVAEAQLSGWLNGLVLSLDYRAAEQAAHARADRSNDERPDGQDQAYL
jgi:hypothetical protein